MLVRILCSGAVALALVGCELIAGIEPPDSPGDNPSLPVGDASSWWRSDYALRRAILIEAGDSALPAGFSAALVTDTAALVAANEALASGDDWRVIHHGSDGATELDRWIDDGEGGGWGATDTRTWFRLPGELAASTTAATIYVYYNNPDEQQAAPAEMNNVFVFGDDFEGDLGKWSFNGRDEEVDLISNAVRAGSRSLQISPGDERLAGLHRDQDLPDQPLLFSHYLRQNQTGASFGNLRLYETPFAEGVRDWADLRVRGALELDSGNRLQFWSNGGYPVFFNNYGVNTWRLVELAFDQANKHYIGRVDGGLWSGNTDDYNNTTLPIRGFALDSEGQGGTFQFDNYIIRFHVPDEPTVTLGSVERVEDF